MALILTEVPRFNPFPPLPVNQSNGNPVDLWTRDALLQTVTPGVPWTFSAAVPSPKLLSDIGVYAALTGAKQIILQQSRDATIAYRVKLYLDIVNSNCPLELASCNGGLWIKPGPGSYTLEDTGNANLLCTLSFPSNLITNVNPLFAQIRALFIASVGMFGDIFYPEPMIASNVYGKSELCCVQTKPQIEVAPYLPPVGYANAGDIIRNTSVVAGQPIGWRCTVSGNPGTWIPMPVMV